MVTGLICGSDSRARWLKYFKYSEGKSICTFLRIRTINIVLV